MLLFLTLTQQCQLSCKYCGSSTNDDIEECDTHPQDLSYDLNHLLKFNSVPHLIICFYGGEPLLQMGIIEKVIKLLPKATFALQTNGLLLSKLKDEVLHALHTILVSIDGNEETTDANRGKGTYAKIIEAVKSVKARNYKGDMIARMTVSEVCDIYQSVMHLLSLGLFNHVHWQLDAEWDSEITTRWKDFYGWKDKVYNTGITKLLEVFEAKLKEGVVLGIVPFLGLLKSFVKGEKVTRVRCGAGASSFNITTGGFINACPIAPEFDPFGDIREGKFTVDSLVDKKLVEEPCTTCPIFSKCGGRCLYVNKTKWWGMDGYKAVCNTIYHLVNGVEKLTKTVQDLLEQNKVSEKEIMYPWYNNSCEIIP